MSKKKPSQESPAQNSQPLQRNWPLGGGTHDILTTELEWSVLRFYSAFERSCEQLADMAGSPETNFFGAGVTACDCHAEESSAGIVFSAAIES